MAFWTNLIGFMSGAGYRQKGIQLAGPGGYSSSSAVPVTLDTSLQVSAVWACTRLITESVSSLPLVLYKRAKDGSRTIVRDHPLVELFAYKVNRWQTRIEFFESLIYQFVLLGNCFAAIQRNAQQKIIQIVPLMTAQMKVDLLDSGAVEFVYQTDSQISKWSSKEVWHMKLFGNGIVGLNPIAYARDCFGIAQAAQSTTTKIYKNGGKPSGVLSSDKLLSPEQRTQIKGAFSELADGQDSRLFVLEAGFKYDQVSMSPQDIELLASRRFQVEDIARFFMVPSVLINDSSQNTSWGSGIQQIVEGFYKFGLRPYLERIEASMNTWLLTPEERVDGYEFEFDLTRFLELGQADRIKTAKEGVTGGIITPNEARAVEGLPAQEGGDTLFMQQQMVPVNLLKDIQRGKVDGQQQQNNI